MAANLLFEQNFLYVYVKLSLSFYILQCLTSLGIIPGN